MAQKDLIDSLIDVDAITKEINKIKDGLSSISKMMEDMAHHLAAMFNQMNKSATMSSKLSQYFKECSHCQRLFKFCFTLLL